MKTEWLHLKYNNDGDVLIKNISFVFPGEAYPVKAEKNTLIIRSPIEYYYSLHTKTGKSILIEYNSEVDTVNMPDEVKIDFTKAQSIALNEICDAA